MSKDPTFAEMVLFSLVALFIILVFGWYTVKSGKMRDQKTTIDQDRRTQLQDSLRGQVRVLKYVVLLLVGTLLGIIFVFALDEPPARKSNKREKEIKYNPPPEDEDQIIK